MISSRYLASCFCRRNSRFAAQGVELCAQELYDGSSSIAKGRELTASILKYAPETECIYYSSDVMSIGGLMFCIAEGLSVPGDLALAGVNGLDQLEGLPVKLATTNAFRLEIGQKAAEIILGAGQGDPTAGQKIHALEAVVDIGDSL
jgi:LacI family gluconate utilization system Gnt-I transcriptional repressor